MPPNARTGIPAISAHRGGGESASRQTYSTFRAAVAAGAEFVEFDVRRTRDGALVVYHDARAARRKPVATLTHAELCRLVGYDVPLAAEVMRLLAGRAMAHLDLKSAESAAPAVESAVEILGPGGFVATTGDSAVLAKIKSRYPTASAGLTIGGKLADDALRVRRSQVAVTTVLGRAISCRADWAVLHRGLARRDLLEQCQRRGIRTMIWTVNHDRALSRWLAQPWVDVVVTDRPTRAAAIRNRQAVRS